MPDIFISYKKEEREVAALLAMRLTAAGYDVWWDDALLAGERFEDEISAVLDEARVVVVLWSAQSIKSDWVKAEAELARQQKKGLPVIIDDLPASKMPLLYRGVHAARLTGWDGDIANAGYLELLGSIRDRLGRATGPKLSEPQAEAKLERSAEEAREILERAAPATEPRPKAAVARPASPIRWIAAAVLVVVLAVGGTFAWLQLGTIPAADLDAIARCTAWSGSARTDWLSGLPRLEATTAADCATALSRAPDDGDALGRLAMVRVVQGADVAPEAIGLATRGIEKKSAIANYVLGAMYGRGINLASDPAKAAQYFKAASDLGWLRATGRLCLMAVDGNGTLPLPVTTQDIRAWCKQSADAGDAWGQLAEGYMEDTGLDGRVPNATRAVALYRAASDQGSDEAAVRLGIMYDRGAGVERNFGTAVGLYQSAADNGSPDGMRSLALSLELGNGIQQDNPRAARLYEQASILHDVPALFLVGYGVPQGFVATVRNVRDMEMLAASPTLVSSHRLRGQMLARGFLRTLDVAAAETEFKSCADVGSPFCIVALGNFYQSGMNGTRDPGKALPLYQSAADRGDLYAQYWLGYMYDVGDGVPKDPSKAIGYYRLAANQGHLTAINRLAQLGNPIQ